MKNKRIGEQTVKFENPPKIIATYSIVGPKEGEGPLGQYFDEIITDDLMGKDSFEKAEIEFMYSAVRGVLKKGRIKEEDVNYLCAGDLLNQITSSGFVARRLKIPFFGLYGACSTMSEALSLGSIIMDGGFADYVVVSTSSHFSSAERQFRFPLEYGSQRSPLAQWTVTGSGAMLLAKEGDYPEITYVTTGIVKDYGIKDVNNMGAAMAPAAVDTIAMHFKDTGRTGKDYDAIVTGDLGKVGKEIASKLLSEYGYDISKNFFDCGDMIFDDETQKTNAGGSGCGCSAAVSSGYFYNKMMKKEIKRILLVATGALHSPTSTLQGDTIPGIAHAVAIEYKGGKK